MGGEGGILGVLEQHDLDAVALPSAVAFEVPALVGAPIVTVPLGATCNRTPVKKEAFGDAVEIAIRLPFVSVFWERSGMKRC